MTFCSARGTEVGDVLELWTFGAACGPAGGRGGRAGVIRCEKDGCESAYLTD